MAETAVKSRLPLDVTRGKSVWRSAIGDCQSQLIGFGTDAFAMARSRQDACDIVSAEIVEFLSSMNGVSLAFFFVPVRRAYETFQWDGVIEALSLAKEDSLIRHIGLSCEGPSLAALLDWQFRDCYDAIVVKNEDARSDLHGLASERRVALIADYPQADATLPHIHSVCSTQEIVAIAGARV